MNGHQPKTPKLPFPAQYQNGDPISVRAAVAKLVAEQARARAKADQSGRINGAVHTYTRKPGNGRRRTPHVSLIKKLTARIRVALEQGQAVEAISERLHFKNMFLTRPWDLNIELLVRTVDQQLEAERDQEEKEDDEDPVVELAQNLDRYNAELEKIKLEDTTVDFDPKRTAQPLLKQRGHGGAKKSPARRRVYLSQAVRDWLTRLRREGENGFYTVTQNVAEVLVRLPPVEQSAYGYMRALAHNRECPGSFYISHKTLAMKLGLKERRTKDVTKHLREWDLIELKRRGAGLYGTANFYSIRPLTQALLDALRERFHHTRKVHLHAPTRVHGRALHRLSKERKTAGAVRGLRPPHQQREKVTREALTGRSR